MRNHPEIALLPRHSGNTCVMTYVLAAHYTRLKTPWVFLLVPENPFRLCSMKFHLVLDTEIAGAQN